MIWSQFQSRFLIRGFCSRFESWVLVLDPVLGSGLNFESGFTDSQFWFSSPDDCISLFVVFLEILLLQVTLRCRVIGGLLKLIWHRISADQPPSASMMEPKYTKALTFSYSLKAVETGRHLLIRSSNFSLAIFTRLTISAISFPSDAIKVVSSAYRRLDILSTLIEISPV